jgi:hypothetical protein
VKNPGTVQHPAISAPPPGEQIEGRESENEIGDGEDAARNNRPLRPPLSGNSR